MIGTIKWPVDIFILTKVDVLSIFQHPQVLGQCVKVQGSRVWKIGSSNACWVAFSSSF